MPDAGYFGLTYELLFEGDSAWTDITALVDSRTTKIDIAGCSEELKSVISKCTFEMRYNTNPSKTVHSELVGKILSAKQAGKTVKFRMGGIASFVGKVDLGSFSQRNGRIPGFLTVTVEDNSYLLDEVMASSFEYPATNDLDDEGWAVFDKANLAESIVMLRFLDAGYTVDQIDLTTSDSITEKVRRVVYDADDERTYREMLDTLLFEHCAVIYTTPEGKLSVRRLYRESPVSERSVEEFLVGDGIETGGGDYSYDGVKVVWSNLSKLDGAVVYNANITMKLDDEGNREGEEIQPHHYWPEDGDIEETWQEFNATFLDREYQTKVSRTKNKDLSLISVKNAYYEVDKDAEILLANNPPEIEPTKARVLWWNSHSTDVKKLYGFTIVGDALFRSRLNESTYPTDARKLAEPYETEFVYTSEAAQKLANHLHRFYKYGDIHHRWSEIGVDTPMFQVVTVSAPDTLISSLGMVISQSISFPAPNKIKRSNSAIGITAFNSEPVRTRSTQLGGAPVNTGPAGSNGTRSVVQFILGTADGPYSDAGNVVGTDSAVVGTSLALVGVDGAQWAYEAPTPDAGEFVWRREGYYTPPETWPSTWEVIRITGANGADARAITLTASQTVINTSSRGELKTQEIVVTCTPSNLPIESAVWTATDAGSLSEIEIEEGVYDPYNRILDCSLVEGNSTLITVSITYAGETYTGVVGITKVADGTPSPLYLDAQSSVPTLTTEGPLIVGDFFLYVGAYSGPNSDPGDQGLNPPALEINEFVYGRIYEYRGKDALDVDQWQESRKSEHLAAAQKDALQIAKDSNTYMFVAVLVAQLGLFFDLIVAGVLKSPNYAENASGVPTAGFKLDGLKGLIKALGLEAYEAMIYGNLQASGFKTLQEEPGTTIATVSITPTIWKHSEMEALIANQDSLATVSGTIDGYSFTKATRRLSQRILLASHGYEYEAISAGEIHYFTQLYPSKVFGLSFRCKFSGYYEGNFSQRMYYQLSGPYNDSQSAFELIRFLNSSYSVDTTYSLSSGYNSFVIRHSSFAVFGKRGSYVNYHQVWTEPVFSGLVLVNGESSYRVIPPEPNAYYSNTKTWTIGSYNQNNITTYCSGTDFYNLFSSLAIGADGFCDGGQINVNGTLYTVTRLTKAANSITFYTSGGVITVNKFQEGTNVGVYTELAVTQAINFQAVVGGIEVKHIFPWGTQADSPGSYDIGTSDARFNTLWLKILDVLNAVRFRSTLQVDGAASMASVNTGSGAMTFDQGVKTTDSPTFASVNTGYGDNEVFKISKETLAFGTVGGSGPDTVTKQISAMAIDEIRFVNTTGTMSSSTQNDYLATLKAPAGGTYLIIGAVVSPNYGTPVQTGGFLFSGGSTIWSIGEESDDTKSLNTAFIIRKLTS